MKRKILLFITVLSLIVTATAFTGCTQVEVVNGKSAYELAVEAGFEGTLEEWLDSLKGEDGKDATSTDTSTTEVNMNIQGTDTVKYAANKGLRSIVSVYCNFTKKVSYGGFFGGQTTRTYDYYSAGSGVIYKLDKETGSALIITNYHVVYDSSSLTENHISNDISVYLYGSEGDEYAIPAKYIGGSINYDIAILQVENSDFLKESSAAEVEFADSDVIVAGETAIAIGNPEMLGISVTVGHVSVVDEMITMQSIDGKSTMTSRVIRIDTAINGGNSGGGLFNEDGKLIGIVNAKLSSDEATDIAYSIPVNLAKNVADSVIFYCLDSDNEQPMRPLIEISVKETNCRAVYNEETGLFMKVEDVIVSGTSSSELYASISTGDKIVSVSIGDVTKQVTRKYILTDMILCAKTGDTVTITFEHEGSEYSVDFAVTESNTSGY